MEWDKAFITNVYGPDGYNKLQEYFAKVGGPNSEWSTAHAFETEQLAIAFDGEWRNAFIEDDGANLNYGTGRSPLPTITRSSTGRVRSGGTSWGSHPTRRTPPRHGCS